MGARGRRAPRRHRQKQHPCSARHVAANKVSTAALENRVKGQIQQLNAKNSELASMELEISNLASNKQARDNRVLAARMYDYSRKFKIARNERAVLQQKLDEERAAHHAQLVNFRESLATTNESFANSQRNANGLRNELSQTRKDLQDLRNQRTAILNRLNESAAENAELRDELRICEEDAALCQRELGEIARELAASQAAAQQLKNERDEALENLELAQKAAAWWQNVALAAAGLIVSVNAENNDLKAQLAESRQDLNLQSKQLAEAKSDVDRLERELAASNSATAETRRELSEQLKLAQDRQTSTDSYVKALQQKLDQVYIAYQSRVSALEEEKAQLEAVNQFLAQSLQEKGVYLQNSQQEIRDLRAAVAESEQEKQAMQLAAEALTATVEELSNEQVALQSELSTSNAQLASVTHERDEARKECEELKEVLAGAVVVVAGAIVLGGLIYLGFSIFKKLFSESDESPSREEAIIPKLDESTVKVVVENERWWPFPMRKWTKTLLPTDRYLYTKADGRTESSIPSEVLLLPNEAWDGEWSVESLGSDDGWLYAIDFTTAHYTANFPLACVRRRIHSRRYKFTATAPEHKSDLKVGESLVLGQELRSVNGGYNLILQHDGNLVLYALKTNKALWSTKTSGRAVGMLTLQHDGNLVLYDPPQKKALWSSKTGGHNDVQLLQLQCDGNVALCSSTISFWSTGTAQK